MTSNYVSFWLHYYYYPRVQPFICMWDWPNSAAQHERQCRKLCLVFIHSCNIVGSKPVPSASSKSPRQLTKGCLIKKVNKPARNLWVPVQVRALTRHQWDMLVAMKGPKLKDTESSAVISRACTEFCSRRRGRILTKISAQGSYCLLVICISDVKH